MPFELKRYLNWFRNYSQSNARVLIGPLLSPFVYLKVLIGHSCVESQGNPMPFELKRYLNWFRNYSQSNARVLIGPLLSPLVYLEFPIGHSCVELQGESNAV